MFESGYAKCEFFLERKLRLRRSLGGLGFGVVYPNVSESLAKLR